MCFGFRVTFAPGLKIRGRKPGCTKALVNFLRAVYSLLKA